MKNSKEDKPLTGLKAAKNYRLSDPEIAEVIDQEILDLRNQLYALFVEVGIAADKGAIDALIKDSQMANGLLSHTQRSLARCFRLLQRADDYRQIHGQLSTALQQTLEVEDAINSVRRSMLIDKVEPAILHSKKFKTNNKTGKRSPKAEYVKNLMEANPGVKSKALYRMADTSIVGTISLSRFRAYCTEAKKNPK